MGQMVRLFEVLTPEGYIHKTTVIWPVRSCYHLTLVTPSKERDWPVKPLILPIHTLRVTPSTPVLSRLLVNTHLWGGAQGSSCNGQDNDPIIEVILVNSVSHDGKT